MVVTGSGTVESRAAIASALLALVPDHAWVILDAGAEPVTTDQLGAIIAGGVSLGVTYAARDLKALLDELSSHVGLPEDVIRRLGLVAVVEATAAGPRIVALHYLRPTERDAQGHVQRRPPVVLATWDRELDVHDHFAWGVTPELADRVDRSQADLEERHRDRAAFIQHVAASDAPWSEAAAGYLLAEPERVPAPEHPTAKPSPFDGGGLTEPDSHVH